MYRVVGLRRVKTALSSALKFRSGQGQNLASCDSERFSVRPCTLAQDLSTPHTVRGPKTLAWIRQFARFRSGARIACGTQAPRQSTPCRGSLARRSDMAPGALGALVDSLIAIGLTHDIAISSRWFFCSLPARLRPGSIGRGGDDPVSATLRAIRRVAEHESFGGNGEREGFRGNCGAPARSR